ncbi:MAG: DNA repair protein RecN [Clostridia bacterium]|jgi:DNA repair protein RecN (Recombination protein N)|nr:DNA repair protein RecN [Clostridia bacterium]
MLSSVYIKNFILVDELTIDFEKGFNVMTGETGAGKSIILGAINFALGERVKSNLCKDIEKDTFVDLLFVDINETTKKVAKVNDIELSEGNIIISRKITKDGKTSVKINGRPSTLSIVKEITKDLIDIHGQHEHQKLFDKSGHINYLDFFCDDIHKQNIMEYKKELVEYKETRNKLELLMLDNEKKEREIDRLSHEVKEIKVADLKESEEETVYDEYKKMSNYEKVNQAVMDAYNNIYKGEEELSAVDNIINARNYLENISTVDEEIKSIYNTIENVSIILEDTSLELRAYIDKMYFDEEKYHDLEKRLFLINDLKRKYGNSVEEILMYLEKSEERLNVLININEEIEKLNRIVKDKETILNDIAFKISKKRKEISRDLELSIENSLNELEMEGAKFNIRVETADEFFASGKDKVEFLIGTNGRNVDSLSKIASGGELSRLMLVLKTVGSFKEEAKTLIFDEIDSGISGRTAQKVAEKIISIANNSQIISVTHLPQISAMADNHYKIIKEDRKTNVLKLDDSEVNEELARLLGGVSITENTLIAAKEMKDIAKEYKKIDK